VKRFSSSPEAQALRAQTNPAELDYEGKPAPSFPLINTFQERHDMLRGRP
jgi:hypothetical protein